MYCKAATFLAFMVARSWIVPVIAQAPGLGTSCDTSATGGDSSWRNSMHSELLDTSTEAYSMINAMCHPGSTPSSKFWDCTKAPNSPSHCTQTVSTLSYNLTFEKWSASGDYEMCDGVASLINGFCTSSRPSQQGSGYYRSSSDNYNLAITYNAPFVTCDPNSVSGDQAPPSLMASLEQSLCGANACQYTENTSECDRQARASTQSYVKLIGKNYGSGGRARCGAVVEELISRCVQKGARAGGNWGSGDPVNNEYYEMDWVFERFQEPEFLDDPKLVRKPILTDL